MMHVMRYDYSLVDRFLKDMWGLTFRLVWQHFRLDVVDEVKRVLSAAVCVHDQR